MKIFISPPTGPGLSGEAMVPAFGSEDCPSRTNLERLENEQRQTGRTTFQLSDAPKGAIYVWPHAHSLGYPKRIARQIGREDITIISEEMFRTDFIQGKRDVLVVIDHATKLTNEGWRAWELAGYSHITPMPQFPSGPPLTGAEKFDKTFTMKTVQCSHCFSSWRIRIISDGTIEGPTKCLDCHTPLPKSALP
jgi:hypothetical protein